MFKQCIKPNCGRKYRVCDEGFGLNNCKFCGAALELVYDDDNNISHSESEGELNHTVMLDQESIFNEINKTIELDTEKKETVLDNKEDYFKDNNDNINDDLEFTIYQKLDLEETAILSQEEQLELKKGFLEENDREEEVKSSDILEVDDFGYIYFQCNNEKVFYGEKILLYLDDIIYKVIDLKYDEMIIGRASRNNNPDVDLGPIDLEKIVSRKHGILYKRNGDFYVRNIASQNSLRVNSIEVLRNQDKKLSDGDSILLSGRFRLDYIKK